MGPHMEPLRPWASKLAILNGVHIRTANHDAGSWQVQRLKTGVEQQMPTLLHLLGRHREGQPIGACSWGSSTAMTTTPAGSAGWSATSMRRSPRTSSGWLARCGSRPSG